MIVTVVFVIAIVFGTVLVHLLKKNRKGSTPSTDERSQKETRVEKQPETNKKPPVIEADITKRIATPDRHHNEQKISVYNSTANQKPVVEGLPTLNYSKEIFVEYDASQKESTSLYYPFVKVPKRGTAIKYPVKGKSCRRGIVESSFVKDFLDNYFKGLIFDNLTVFIGSTPFEPDIAFIDVNHKNLFIDIEIDEPYDGIDRKPIHYVENGNTIDERRNKNFTDRGWMVIRFSERQIKEDPVGCCRFIYEIYNYITGISDPNLQSIPVISKEKMWTKAEADQMAKDRIREKYLGIAQFVRSDTPRQYSIKDYSDGQKIESKLKGSSMHTQQPTTTINPTRNVAATVSAGSIMSNASKPQAPQPSTLNNTPTPRVTTQPTNQPATPAPRPYAYE